MRSGTHVSTVRDYAQVVARRKWVIVQAAVLVPVAAVAFSLHQQTLYRASADVLLSQQDLGNALTATQDTNVYTPADRRAQTQADLARVPAVAQRALRAVRSSGLTPQALLDESSVAGKQNADLLTFSVTNHDPVLAVRLATAYANAYTAYRLQVETRPIEAAVKEVQTRIDALASQRGSLYATLVDKEQTLKTMEALKTSNASVVRQAAGAPRVAPKPTRNGLIGLILGLALGIGLAFLREALDTRIRSAEEIGDRLRLPLLARLPEPPRKLRAENRLAMLADPTGVQAEAFRMLRTNLEFATLGKRVRTVMFTSAVEQEGKSTTAANLAVALARADQRVVLVDLDLRRPFVDRFFDVGRRPGLTQVALGRASLDRALVPVTLPSSLAAKRAARNGHRPLGSLSVLASGPIPPDPGEFVGADRLTEILEQLRARFDVVLVYTPPVLHVGDALVLSGKVDAVVVVARLQVLRRAMVEELGRLLETIPADKLGFVATGAGAEQAYAGYGYGGYGYRRHEQAVEA